LRTDLRVVTNGFPIAAALAPCAGIEVILLGGILRHETASLVGPFAPQMLASLHADSAFVSAGALSLTRGLTDAYVREVEVKRAMIQAADELVALVDASKFGRDSFLTFATLADLDILITDGPVPANLAARCAAENVRIILA
jgi:DeoR/GlpR family transcriptional regulator of sugar metabolism